MWISDREMTALADALRKAMAGQPVDFRDNREGALSVLKNDLYAFASLKNEQLTAAEQEQARLTETLADISHQLKTPITSLHIMADLMEDAPPEKQAELLANLKISLTRMEWLTDTLLKLAKLDAGAVAFTPSEITVSSLLRTALEPLAILLDVKDQRVELLHDTSLFCDKRWTAEALTNLLKNASEYSPAGSVLVVDSGENPIYRWFSVTDAGSGLRRDEIAGLFRRFEGSRSEKGNGIGLPLALSILRGQNGDLAVDGGGDRTGPRGATFTAKLFK